MFGVVDWFDLQYEVCRDNLTQSKGFNSCELIFIFYWNNRIKSLLAEDVQGAIPKTYVCLSAMRRFLEKEK